MQTSKFLRAALLAAVFCTGSAFAADDAGTIKVSKGTASIERDGSQLAATVGSRVFVSDRIVTGADGSVGITLNDNTLLSAGPNSVLELNKFAFNTTTHVGVIDASVKRGTLSVISGKIVKTSPDAVQFRTPSAILGVRGTEFVIDAGNGGN